jgi:hypothetical protein
MPGGMVVDEELHLRHYEPPDKINYIQVDREQRYDIWTESFPYVLTCKPAFQTKDA